MADAEEVSSSRERSSAAPMVSLRGVNKHFGALHVLKDIDLDVQRGEVVVVLGPSGSGKSTLCRTINRLETVDTGAISVDGVPLPAEGRALARLRSDVGMVFQSFNLFAHKTIIDNVTLAPVKVLGATLRVRCQVRGQHDESRRRLTSAGGQTRAGIIRRRGGGPSRRFGGLLDEH